MVVCMVSTKEPARSASSLSLAARATSNSAAAARIESSAPRVTATSLAPNGVAAPGNLSYVVTFSEPARHVDTTTMAIWVKGRQHRLSAAVTMSNGGRTATLNPARNLMVGKAHTLRLLKGITDRAGNPLTPLGWTVSVK